MAQDIKDGESRIIYLEPNDAMDDINGVPMTPDYPDLCIAFNLIVEVVPIFALNHRISAGFIYRRIHYHSMCFRFYCLRKPVLQEK